MIQATPEAYQLLHEGSVALADVSEVGMPVDVDYCKRAINHLGERIERLSTKLKKDKHWGVWRKTYGHKANLDSDVQLKKVLYGVCKYPVPEEKTATGDDKADANALKSLGVPFADNLLLLRYAQKCLDVLKNILWHTIDGRVHPSFNLHIAVSYRSSCTEPNLQNIPVRNPYHLKMIRRAFRVPKDYYLVEIDYSGVEVSIAACYHKDPVMLSYLLDPTKDMHRDMAAQIFKCQTGDVSSKLRYYGKNGFVFPEFYGSYYIDRTKQLWSDAVMNRDINICEQSVRDWLREQGIRKRGVCDPKQKPRAGTFEKHIQQVEQDFWGNRFKVYSQWKEDWYNQYLKTGAVQSLTGFIYSDNMARNQVINYPVQGSAFHCLLWSVIRLVHAIRKLKMRSRVIGQIHDSVLAQVHKSELDDYLGLAQDIMCNRLLKAWDWIIVPLKVEADVTPLGGTWYDKQSYAIPA